jgi:hypothetical protein
MINKFNKIFFYYLSFLFLFSIIFLTKKYTVGNDSTISEWLINYQGGFSKRGLIGQIIIIITNFFKINLRQTILFSQIFVIGAYFILLFKLFKNTNLNRTLLLSIFTPIFILYPVAEIEVLARKEVFIFCIFLIYLNLSSKLFQNLYKIIFLSIGVLIWEPIIFYFLFFISVDIFKNDFRGINIKFLANFIYYLPAILISFFIALNPMSEAEHQLMSNFLINNYNETCYMSCALLKSKSSIYDQFNGNLEYYSFEVFFRYTLIILIGFFPLFILLKNSSLKNTNLIFFKSFKNLLTPLLLILSPVIILFAMGYDWGRWVNISYAFSIIFYFYFYKTRLIKLNKKIDFYETKIFLNKKKFYIIFFIIFCFGWNQKTVMTGDIATNPLWKIPYNASKIVFGFNNFRILQDSPLSIWHKKFIE